MNDVLFRQALRDRMKTLNRRVRHKQEHMTVIRDDDDDIAERKILRRIAKLRNWQAPLEEE